MASGNNKEVKDPWEILEVPTAMNLSTANGDVDGDEKKTTKKVNYSILHFMPFSVTFYILLYPF